MWHANPSVVYATTVDLGNYITEPVPSNAVVLLRSASGLVRAAIAGAHYYADDTGLPTDTGILGVLTEATCAQAAAWITLGIDPLAGGVLTQSQIKASQSLDGAAVSFADGTAASSARQDAATTLVPEAVRILSAYGLLNSHVWTYG